MSLNGNATELSEKAKKAINAWCMYDWGSSGFSTTIEATVLPVYFSTVIAANLGQTALSYWAYLNAFALLVSAILSPILGSLADYTGSKKRFLLTFASVGILATALMFFLDAGAWVLALGLFFFGTIGLSGSYVFYDSLLPHVAPPDKIDYVSSKGYALGYVGGGILLAANIAMINSLDGTLGVRLSLLSVAVWWAIFTIPLILHVSEPEAHGGMLPKGLPPIQASFMQLRQTFGEIRKYRELFKYLIAFWLFNDGIGTIIKMATIYGSKLGIGNNDLIGALLLTQFVGIPFSLLFGRFSKVLGTKRSIMAGLGWYAVITVAAYFMSVGWHFWALAFAVGMVQGGTQGLSRSLFGQMAPRARSAEFFGFYDVSSKFAGILGPLLFGVINDRIGSPQLAIAAICIFFLAGIFLLTRVNEAEGIRIAELENAKAGA